MSGWAFRSQGAAPWSDRLLNSKLKSKTIIVLALLAHTSFRACAEELAILGNGFVIRHVRHEVRDGVMRLYLTDTQDNYVEVAKEKIERFEELEVPPSAVPEEAATSPVASGGVQQAISNASTRSRIDPELIESIIRAESGFNAKAVSPKGAQGLMQLMPMTAARLGVENAMDPVANVEGGTRYLEELLARYDDDLVKALAAYNAGPLRVDQYRGVPPYRETRAYVAKIITDFNRKKMVHGSALEDPGQESRSEGNPGSPAKKTPRGSPDTGTRNRRKTEAQRANSSGRS